MSNSQNALEKFTRARAALAEHIEENKKLFDAHQNLVGNVMDAENELRDAVAESGVGVSNALFNVTCTPQVQTFVDPEDVRMYVADTGLREKLIKTITRLHRISISKQPGA